MFVSGVTSPWWVKWFYRITAPRHPRGWVEFELLKGAKPTTLRTKGMSSKRLPELEMVDPPLDLLGPVHGIFMALMETIVQAAQPPRSGDTLGGKFVSEEQTYIQTCRLRDVRAGASPRSLRICDIDESVEDGSPRRLIATHLCALAESARTAERFTLLKRATEIYPDVVESSAAPLEQWATNPNNFGAWEGLGNAFADRGDADQAIRCWRKAVAHWPAGGLYLGKSICAQLDDGRLRADKSIRDFWCELSPERIQDFCHEFGLRSDSG
jgi:hypothetical protein